MTKEKQSKVTHLVVKNTPSPLAGEGEERSDGGVGFPHNDVCDYTNSKCEWSLTMGKYEPRPCGCNTRKLVNNRFPAHKGWGLRGDNPQSLISSNHFTHFIHLTHLTHFKKAVTRIFGRAGLADARTAPYRKFGFTLAEILVTLGVIGVVAAMTIPTLVQNYQEKVTITKVKKMYGILSNAYQLSVLDYGRPSEWGIEGRDAGSKDEEEETYNAVNAILVRDRILKHVKTTKVCDNAKNQKECGVDVYYQLDGKADNWATGSSAYSASAQLFDGGTILVEANQNTDGQGHYRGSGALAHTYGLIFYDINGIKAPNVFGKDIFTFNLTNVGIIPVGTKDETFHLFDTECSVDGAACTAWVIEIGNMDYLKCDDLSWDGKHKCSD